MTHARCSARSRKHLGEYAFPIGPRFTDPHGFRCAFRSVQVIEDSDARPPRRWVVGVFFEDLHLDLRFRLRRFPTKAQALKCAFALAKRRLPGATIAPWCEHWVASSGKLSLTIMIAESL
jgi:hypothetical protein